MTRKYADVIDEIIMELAAINARLEIMAGGPVRRRRGRPNNTYSRTGNRLAAQLYEELRKNFPHDEALLYAANRFKTTVESVRKAVTARRNSEK
jgi:hypothetical protein